MVNIALLMRGIVIGFSIAAPVGPIGVLCIRRTLAEGRAVGLATGLGAASADALYGCIAALGITALTDVLVGGQVWIRLLGGLFLLYLGLRAFAARPTDRAAQPGTAGLLGAYSSSLLLTLTNPMTILSFVAVFAALGLGAVQGGSWGRASLVIGVLFGSALWWLTLTAAVGALRSKLDERGIRWVNRVSGIIIVAFGIAAIGSAAISGSLGS